MRDISTILPYKFKEKHTMQIKIPTLLTSQIIRSMGFVLKN